MFIALQAGGKEQEINVVLLNFNDFYLLVLKQINLICF